jgi:hypothetical protein
LKYAKGSDPIARAIARVIGALGVLLALLSPPLAAAAAPSVFDHPTTAPALAQQLSGATQGLKGAQTLRGGYTQLKHLAGVPKPLEASGTFLFVRGRGIAWRTTQPFESELIITSTDIIQREGGRVAMHLSAARQPSVRVVADIFSAVFALDFEALAARFELFGRRVGAGWEVGLRPRAGGGAGPKQIVVSGRRQVERVRVADSNGDQTDIRLRDTTLSAAAPAADEMKRFDP